MGLKWFTSTVGIFFLFLGIIGFFLEDLLGWVHFDLTHNLLHLVVGILGIFAANSVTTAQLYAKLLGIFYIGVGIIGFFNPEFFGHMMLEMSENILHLVVGAIALYVGYVAESKYAVRSKSPY